MKIKVEKQSFNSDVGLYHKDKYLGFVCAEYAGKIGFIPGREYFVRNKDPKEKGTIKLVFSDVFLTEYKGVELNFTDSHNVMEPELSNSFLDYFKCTLLGQKTIWVTPAPEDIKTLALNKPFWKSSFYHKQMGVGIHNNPPFICHSFVSFFMQCCVQDLPDKIKISYGKTRRDGFVRIKISPDEKFSDSGSITINGKEWGGGKSTYLSTEFRKDFGRSFNGYVKIEAA